MTPKMKDIAKRAGVSKITVSRAFSGTHPVAESTRQRIFEIAKEMGYSPNLLARALVQRRTQIIGVVVPDLTNPFFSPVIEAIHTVAQENQHMVLISQSKGLPENEKASLYQFQQMHVAGILPLLLSPDLDYLQNFKNENTSVVVATREWEQGDYVAVDHFKGGWLVGEHLLQLGHRTFGCVTVESGFLDVPVQSRIEGFSKAVREGNGELRENWVLKTNEVRVNAGMDAADKFLNLSERPTAVFLASDQLAIGFIHRLLERGVRVPDDVAVVGYDDIRYAEFLEVPLTSVSLPKKEMGKKAAEILFEQIKSGETGQELHQIILQPKLVIRRSSQP